MTNSGHLSAKSSARPNRLDEVGGNHREGMPIEDRDAEGKIAFETLDRARENELRLDVELLRELALPLLGQMRRAEHRDSTDLAAIEQLPRDETRFDGLPDADVVRDEHAHRIELERHHQRHELIRPGLDGDAAEAAERTGGRAGRQARRVAQQPPPGEVSEVPLAGQSERRRSDGLDPRQDACDLLVEPADRTNDEHLVRGCRQHDPFAASCLNERPRRGERSGAHVAFPIGTWAPHL